MNNGVFRIEYPTGYMELNVREFFANANKKQMKKVLKLAKQYCSDPRREELIGILRSEVDRLNEVVKNAGKPENSPSNTICWRSSRRCGLSRPAMKKPCAGKGGNSRRAWL